MNCLAALEREFSFYWGFTVNLIDNYFPAGLGFVDCFEWGWPFRSSMVWVHTPLCIMRMPISTNFEKTPSSQLSNKN